MERSAALDAVFEPVGSRSTFKETVERLGTAIRLGLLEGRVSGGAFRNWARRFRYVPERFAEPATAEEIADVVKTSRSLRAFGSAHSFNGGVVSEGTLLSLDRYSGPGREDGAGEREHLGRDQLVMKGGTRVRDVVELLRKRGLAFEALPSHDAQSIGGILSTDVHGTGRDWGFVSDSVVGLELVDGPGPRGERCGGDARELTGLP